MGEKIDISWNHWKFSSDYEKFTSPSWKLFDIFDENITVLEKKNLPGWFWLIVALLCIIPDHCCIDFLLA